MVIKKSSIFAVSCVDTAPFYEENVLRRKKFVYIGSATICWLSITPYMSLFGAGF